MDEAMEEGGARIIPGPVFDARAEAARIVAEASERAEAIYLEARQRGARDGRAEAAWRRAIAGPQRSGQDRPAGVVREVVGLVVRASVPDLRLGELVAIEMAGPRGLCGEVLAEVVGFTPGQALLMPLGNVAGIAPQSRVVALGQPLTVRVGPDLLGTVLDGLGRPLFAPQAGVPAGSDCSRSTETEIWPVARPAPDPLSRSRVCEVLATGVRAIDGLVTLGQGQRVGLLAAAGTGKSSLLGQIARASDADVIVIGLVGERGREVREFLEDALEPAGRERAVVVVATSDAPSLVRVRSAHVATAIAEWFRDRQGARVLLCIDSLTRFVRAQREVGLSVGEPPAQRGYPPSVFAAIPGLIERAGNSVRGSVTAIYTVLTSAGDGLGAASDPVTDEIRAALDGTIELSPTRAARGHWPAIDIVASVSRCMPHVVSPEHTRAAQRVRQLVATYRDHREIIALGAYKPGSDRDLDRAVAAMPDIEHYLCQPASERSPFGESVARLLRLAGGDSRHG